MRVWSKGFGAALVVSAAALMACDPSELFELELGVGDGASEGVKQSALVDGSKAARIELSTGAALSFEKGSVVSPVDIGVERPSDVDSVPFVKALPAPIAVNSAPYVLTPHGTEFKGKVTLELPVARDKGRQQVVAYLENEQDRNWKVLGTPTVSEGIAKIDLTHFSVVILLDAEDAKLGTKPTNSAGSGGTTYTVPDSGSSFSFDGGTARYVDGSVVWGDTTYPFPWPEGGVAVPPEYEYPDGGFDGRPDAHVYEPEDADVDEPEDAKVDEPEDAGVAPPRDAATYNYPDAAITWLPPDGGKYATY